LVSGIRDREEDSKMEKGPAAGPSGEFRIPTDLLKLFQSEVRFMPMELHPNGYIIFDRAMLKKILLSDDREARKDLVTQLDRLEKAGAELVIMGQGALR